MQHVPGDLVRRLADVADRFVHVSAELAQAGRGLTERRMLPPSTLVDELAALHADLEDARLRVQELAATLGIPATSPPAGLKDLEALLRAAADALRRRAEEEARRQLEEQARRREEAEARRRAEEQARRQAEEAARQRAEAEARRRAAEAQRRAADEARRRAAEEARRRAAEEARRLAAAEAAPRSEDAGGQRAEDQPPLQGAVQAGPTGAGDAPPRRERGAQPAAETAPLPAGPAGGDTADSGPPGRQGSSPAETGAQPRPGPAGAGRGPEPSSGAPGVGIPSAPAAPPHAAGPTHGEPPAPESGATSAESPASAPLRTDSADLGIETAQWWIAATAAWASLRSRRMSLADGVREALAKYPYVFSVPIQASADYEDGLLAYGYAVVIDYLEAAVPGFVGEALQRLPGDPPSPLGRRLYEYLGERLRPRYPGFVRAVLEAALPRVAPWLSGSVEETDGTTTVMVRPGTRPGDPHQRLERLVSEVERLRAHGFSMPLGPLTARFVRLEAPELREPRDVEVHLTVQGVPSDHAWVATVAGREGSGIAVRRHDPRGTVLSGLGRELTAVWVAVFNPEADSERQAELTVRVRRRIPSSVFRRPR